MWRANSFVRSQINLDASGFYASDIIIIRLQNELKCDLIIMLAQWALTSCVEEALNTVCLSCRNDKERI